MAEATLSPGSAPQRARVFYFDALRALAAFLVIVNHTNSYVFKATGPQDPAWWLSLLWYYCSKIAVPLFVMISGACLLPKQDSYSKALGRTLRMVLVLVLFSYGYYLWDLWLTHFTWAKALDFPAFLSSIWEKRITDSFWYLYFYIGLLVMLPLLQRLAAGMRKRDYQYFLCISFFTNGLWPLVCHYVPGLQLPDYFDLPLFSVFIGLFFAGRYLHAYAQPSRGKGWLCLLVLAVCLALSVFLTQGEYARLRGAGQYWFMDERTAPAFPVLLSALAVFFLPRCWPAKREKAQSSRWTRFIQVLGGCAFGIYLLQDWVTAETKHRVFEPLLAALPAFPAALLWTLLIFAFSALLAWVLKLIPGIKKLI